MIPERKEIEHLYEKEELDYLDRFRLQINAIQNPRRRGVLGRQVLRKLWPEELLWISKTHWIIDKDARPQLFKPNYAQLRFYKDVIERCREEARPIRGVVLKARQLGFSTFIQAWQYEQCDANEHRLSMTLSFDAPSSSELFSKARTIHSKMWFPHEEERSGTQRLKFKDNGSDFQVRTSGNISAGRSQTIHHAHCSEVPMWADADETLTALSQAVPAWQSSSIFHESTAKGAVGAFYETWTDAVAGRSDYVPFFAPWTWDGRYTLPFPNEDSKRRFLRGLSAKDRVYMERFQVTPEQMHWRSWKIRNDLNGSERKFRQEFPIAAEEAFLTTGSPVFDPDLVRNLEMNARPPQWQGDIFLTQKRERSFLYE